MRTVFVWTLHDIVGLCFVGLIALFGLGWGVVALWETAKRNLKRWLRRG